MKERILELKLAKLVKAKNLACSNTRRWLPATMLDIVRISVILFLIRVLRVMKMPGRILRRLFCKKPASGENDGGFIFSGFNLVLSLIDLFR